jgi:hypothetical protein
LKLNTNLTRAGAAVLLLALAAACGTSAGAPLASVTPPGAPAVLSSSPDDGATGVPPNWSVSAVFSEAMDPATLTATSFTLTADADVTPIPGTLLYSDAMVVFWPAAILADGGSYTATITTEARNLAGEGLAAARAWHFTTGQSPVVVP